MTMLMGNFSLPTLQLAFIASFHSETTTGESTAVAIVGSSKLNVALLFLIPGMDERPRAFF